MSRRAAVAGTGTVVAGTGAPVAPTAPASGPDVPAHGDRVPSTALRPPPPAHELLDRFADGCLSWLEERREGFRLPADVAEDADPDTTLKPLGELAGLTQLIRELHPQPATRDAADRLLAFAWQQAREGELFTELVRGEPHATYPVEIYAAFAAAGLRNEAVDTLLTATTTLRSWRVARYDHTRTLAVLAAEERLGLTPHADFGAVFAQTGLGQLAEPWTLDRTAAYGITHDVFHLTDWGRARHRMPQALAEYLRLWVPPWQECWLEEQLWDLAGEWLAVAACLPRPRHDHHAWARFAAAQREDGSIPETGTRDPHSADPFLACYHSTLVAAFAATLARVALDEPDSAPAAGAGPGAATAARRESEATE